MVAVDKEWHIFKVTVVVYNQIYYGYFLSNMPQNLNLWYLKCLYRWNQ